MHSNKILNGASRHYLESKDFQTIALIVCTFTHHATRKQVYRIATATIMRERERER